MFLPNSHAAFLYLPHPGENWLPLAVRSGCVCSLRRHRSFPGTEISCLKGAMILRAVSFNHFWNSRAKSPNHSGYRNIHRWSVGMNRFGSTNLHRGNAFTPLQVIWGKKPQPTNQPLSMWSNLQHIFRRGQGKQILNGGMQVSWQQRWEVIA